MSKWLVAVTAFSFILAGSSVVSSASPGGNLCSAISFEGNPYTLCTAPLSQFSIRFFWQQPDGKPYNYLRALPEKNERGEGLVMALNAGMFDPDYKPVGLYVENGKELTAANTRPGPGNFHLKPNGVFYVSGGEAGVMETGAFLKKRLRPDFATQSGPMLVIGGRLHPRLSGARTSKKRRDGVCVEDGKIAIFAISEGEVPFDSFERLFRDELKCRNALFLDGGSAPALYLPGTSKTGNTFVPLGPMIAVYEKSRP